MIPWSKPKLFGDEKKFMIDSIKSTWISGGKYIKKFENKFKKYVNVKYAFIVSSGTAAIHLSFLSIGLKPKDEIIIPSYGYMAAANIAKLMNLKIKFVDVDRKSYCISLKNIKKAYTKKTKAVVAINTYGNVFEISEIKSWCKKKNIKLIEDAAESLGSKYYEQHSGTFGDIGTYSLHATKNITTGEGGIVVTNEKNLADKIKLYRSHGVENVRYLHILPGHNFRITNIQASLGLAQLYKIKIITNKRKEIYNKYIKLLDKNKFNFQKIPKKTNFVPWTIAIHPKKKQKKNILEIIKILQKKGIETRNGFFSPNKIKYFKTKKKQSLKNSDHLSESIICLPFFVDLKNYEITKISKSINKLFS